MTSKFTTAYWLAGTTALLLTGGAIVAAKAMETNDGKSVWASTGKREAGRGTVSEIVERDRVEGVGSTLRGEVTGVRNGGGGENRNQEKDKEFWKKVNQVWSSNANAWEETKDELKAQEKEDVDHDISFAITVRRQADESADAEPEILVTLYCDCLIERLRDKFASWEDFTTKGYKLDGKLIFAIRKLLRKELDQEIKERDVRRVDVVSSKPNGINTCNKCRSHLPPPNQPSDKLACHTEVNTSIMHFEALLNSIEEEFKSTTNKLIECEKEHAVPYKLLWAIFPPGELVGTRDPASEERVAFRVKKAIYNGDAFVISGTRLEYVGTTFTKIALERSISSYKDLKRIISLGVYPLSERMRADLLSRGKKYLSFCTPTPKHIKYDGPFVRMGTNGAYKVITNGRGMIDIKTLRYTRPHDDYWYLVERDSLGESASFFEDTASMVENVKMEDDDDIICFPSWQYGYSFSLNIWGRFLLDYIEPVVYDNTLIDDLLIDDENKRILLNVIKTSSISIDKAEVGRACGVRILFHGPSGSGKTFSAKAIADNLHRPLQMVPLSEMAANASNQAVTVTGILELATIWNSIVLLEGADTFLDARSEHDTYRNTSVAVLLELLDEFNGIILMTSTRLRNYDDGLISRVSLAIKFPAFDRLKRERILRKLLQQSGANLQEPEIIIPKMLSLRPSAIQRTISETDVAAMPNNRRTLPPRLPGFESNENLQSISLPASPHATKDRKLSDIITFQNLKTWASKPLNGRMINELVKTAKLLADSEGERLNATHVETVLHLTLAFHEDYSSVDEESSYIADRNERWNFKLPLYN